MQLNSKMEAKVSCWAGGVLSKRRYSISALGPGGSPKNSIKIAEGPLQRGTFPKMILSRIQAQPQAQTQLLQISRPLPVSQKSPEVHSSPLEKGSLEKGTE